MASTFPDVLTTADIQYLTQLPEVVAARAKLDATGVVKFSVPVTETIRTTLRERLGLDLAHLSAIPMRWVKGDTAPHVDVGRTKFDTTYLMYLNDSPGELVVDNAPYPIVKNTAFAFSEGLSHKTLHTANEPRLLLGPMSEQGMAVGGGGPIQYITQDMIDACSGVYVLGEPETYSYYEISGNLTMPASMYFASAHSTANINFSGAGYSITIIGSGTTPYGGLFDCSVTATPNLFVVGNLTVNAQGVILDASAGWFFRYGSSMATATRCNSTGLICEQGSGGIFGADVSGDENDFYSRRAESCFSTGDITGAGAGGIFGANATNCTVHISYSWGDISGAGAGGLIGSDSINNNVYNCYSLGAVDTNAGGILGLNSTFKEFSSNIYVSGARSATGAFIAGSDASGTSFTWGSSWNDVDASGSLVISQPFYGTYWYSWAANTPYRLIAFVDPNTDPASLTAYISQLTATAVANVDVANLNLTPAVTGIQDVTFVPDGGMADVSAGATVYLIGTARTTSTITLNGVSLTVAFKDNCTFSFNGGADVSGVTDVTVGGLTFSLIACGSALINNVRGSSPGPGPGPGPTTPCVQDYLNNDDRVDTVRGNALVRDVKSQPNLQFKTYADYIAYRKSAQRGCCC